MFNYASDVDFKNIRINKKNLNIDFSMKDSEVFLLECNF